MADKLQPARLPYTGSDTAPGQVHTFPYVPAGKTAMYDPAYALGPVRPAMVAAAHAANPPGAVMNNLRGIPAFGAAGVGAGRVGAMGNLMFAPSPNWPSMSPRFPHRAGNPNFPSGARRVPMFVRYAGNAGAFGDLSGFGAPADAAAASMAAAAFNKAGKERSVNKTFWFNLAKGAPARYAGRDAATIYADALYLLKTGAAWASYQWLASQTGGKYTPSQMSGGTTRTTGGTTRTTGGTRKLPASTTPTGSVLRKGAGWREVQGSGGYVYRQYRNGKIVVVSGPALQGTTLTGDSDPRRYFAIVDEIGPYSTSGGIVSLLPSVANALQALAPAASSPAQTADLDPGGGEGLPQVSSGPSVPTIALYAGGGLLGVVALVAIIKALR